MPAFDLINVDQLLVLGLRWLLGILCLYYSYSLCIGIGSNGVQMFQHSLILANSDRNPHQTASWPRELSKVYPCLVLMLAFSFGPRGPLYECLFSLGLVLPFPVPVQPYKYLLAV